jgi:hypothetical protein
VSTNVVQRYEQIGRNAALEALRDQAIEKAKTAAAGVGRIIVTDEASASRLTDALAHVKDGIKIAKAMLEGIVKPHRAAADAARQTFAPILSTLAEAEGLGKDSLQAYANEVARREAEERARLLVAAREAQERQQAESPDTEVPMLEPPPPAPPAQFHGRRAMSYETTVLRCEVVDWKAVQQYAPSLLRLDEAKAKSLYRVHADNGMVATAPSHPNGGVIMFGIRFWKEKTVAIR